MKRINQESWIIIETGLIMSLPILNCVFKFWGTEILVSFLISLVSLIIAHHSYFLAKGTIDSQNSFKLQHEQLNCIIELRKIYSYVILERTQRAKERNPENSYVEKISVSFESTLCKIHLMFSSELYLYIKNYIDMLYVFDYRNPWAEGTKDVNSIENFVKCIDLLESAMCNEIKKNNYKFQKDKYELHYNKLLEWKEKGE